MEISTHKTKYLMLSRNLIRNPTVKYGGKNISRVEVEVEVEEGLKFNTHVQMMRTKSLKVVNKLVT